MSLTIVMKHDVRDLASLRYPTSKGQRSRRGEAILPWLREARPPPAAAPDPLELALKSS